MKVYILQENYTEYVPEAGWDENGSYDEDVERNDVIGVFATLDDAVRKLADMCRLAKELDVYGDEYRDYDILAGDTETTEVRSVLYKEYEGLLAKISCINKAFLSALEVLCGNLYRFGVKMRSTGLKSGKNNV